MTYLVKGLPIDSATGKMGQVTAGGAAVAASGMLLELASKEVLVSTNAAVLGLSGLMHDSTGNLVIFGASGGLPNPTRYCNGLPFHSNGGLCTDGVNAIAYYKDGIPFTTTGAVAAS